MHKFHVMAYILIHGCDPWPCPDVYMYSAHQQVYVQIIELQVPVRKKCNFEKSYLPIYNSKLHEIATCLFKNKLTTF